MYRRKLEGLAAVGASVSLSEEEEEEEKSSANVRFLSALNSAYVLSVVCALEVCIMSSREWYKPKKNPHIVYVIGWNLPNQNI